jgi:DNA-binding response OmpR family regulator
MKILIVEDEKALSAVIKEELAGAKHEVKVAEDGQEGLDLAKSFKPDVLLLDLLLPKKSGLDVLSELKADPSLKTIPVIVMSNLAEDETIKKALALGAEDYFVKTQHYAYEIVEKVQKHEVK